MLQELVVVVLAFQHNMVDKNQQVIDKTIDQEYKYGFTTDIDQTKFEPGLDEEVNISNKCIVYKYLKLNKKRTQKIIKLLSILIENNC